ncbi:MAG TPA: hypothetical protein VHM27_07985, partial [Rhizomicrobium sp.]|nr:hypothetical protein [Rhizomicrobium sp.]
MKIAAGLAMKRRQQGERCLRDGAFNGLAVTEALCETDRIASEKKICAGHGNASGTGVKKVCLTIYHQRLL